MAPHLTILGVRVLAVAGVAVDARSAVPVCRTTVGLQSACDAMSNAKCQKCSKLSAGAAESA